MLEEEILKEMGREQRLAGVTDGRERAALARVFRAERDGAKARILAASSSPLPARPSTAA
jgi:hypothetical protein